MYVSGGYYPGIGYVKKEDAVGYLERQQNMFGWILIILPLIFFVIQAALTIAAPPQQKLGVGLIFEIIIFLASILTGISFFKPILDHSSLEEKLNDYKTGEMINLRDLRPWVATDRAVISTIGMILVTAMFVVGMMAQFGS